MRLIDADKLRETMYYEAFVTDSDMQKWDSGCWIRYKMFENNLDNAPTVDAEPVIRCKDCENWMDDVEERSACEHYCPMADRWTEGSWFCADGEKK